MVIYFRPIGANEIKHFVDFRGRGRAPRGPQSYFNENLRLVAIAARAERGPYHCLISKLITMLKRQAVDISKDIFNQRMNATKPS